MKHGEKFFSIEENQIIWNTYFDDIMNEWDNQNRERLEKQAYSEIEKMEKIKKLSGYSTKGKDDLTPYKFEYRRKKTSIQQYKPIILEFEKNINKSFNDISASDLEKFIATTTKKDKINHLKGFLQDCLSKGLIKSKDYNLLILLLPEGYRYIGKLLVECGNSEVRVSSTENKKIIQCPFCRRKKEAIAKEWMLIQYEGQVEKYLTCKECEGEDGK